jgi:hypothetical protein
LISINCGGVYGYVDNMWINVACAGGKRISRVSTCTSGSHSMGLLAACEQNIAELGQSNIHMQMLRVPLVAILRPSRGLLCELVEVQTMAIARATVPAKRVLP